MEAPYSGSLMRRENRDIQRDTRGTHAKRDNHVNRQQEGGLLQAEERDLRVKQPCQHLVLGLPASRTLTQ